MPETKTDYRHVPVLLKEAIGFLAPRPGENFIDATLGGGGYTEAILQKNQPGGRVLAIDLDIDAIESFRRRAGQAVEKGKVILVHGNFREIDRIAERHKFFEISGIVADIGLSSYELDQAGRGISFKLDEPLDMRFDQSQPEDARFILQSSSQAELEKLFWEYGEEKFSRQIAREIFQLARRGRAVRRTSELVQAIHEALPKPFRHKVEDSARRIFQALRVRVNHELENLEEFLPKAFEILPPGGRLAVVSFHSLEDRRVKEFFVGLSKACVCPPDFPTCICGRKARAEILTKKPVTPSKEELAMNRRSQSAKLRAVIKL